MYIGCLAFASQKPKMVHTGTRGAQPFTAIWVLPQPTVIRVGAAILDQLQIY